MSRDSIPKELVPLSPEEAMKVRHNTGSNLEVAKTLMAVGDGRDVAEMVEAWELNDEDAELLMGWYRSCWAHKIWNERRQNAGRRQGDRT